MKTTIDIPDELYKKARIWAIEQGIRLRELMIQALSREISGVGTPPVSKTPYWSAAELLPEYKLMAESGMLDSSLDSTDSISADRDRA
jgi:hypothetical protein